MNSIVRIILGVAVLIGAFMAKQKATPVVNEGESASPTVSLFGNEIAPGSLNLIVAAFAIAGVVMIVLGVVGLFKRNA